MAKTKDASKMTSEELAQARNKFAIEGIGEIVEKMNFFKRTIQDETRAQNFDPREALAVQSMITNIRKQLGELEFFLTTRR